MKRFIATENDAGVRLSRFVQGVTREMPSSLLYKSFRNKRIKINGKKADPETRLCTGDVIELYINDEFFTASALAAHDAAATSSANGADAPHKPTPRPDAKRTPSAPQPPLQIIFEDDNIAVLYKPARLLCHSDSTGDANLVDAFIAYLTEKGDYNAATENRFKPSICNRLDRGTEGLVIAAKTYAALRDMNEIIRTDCLKKEYYTITLGTPRTGRFTAWWSHHETANKVRVHAGADQKQTRKKIITDIDVLQTRGAFSLCKIGLITGRTHQIRAHLAFLGKPVLGDGKYGNRLVNAQTATKTQALCAARVSFSHIPAQNTLAYLNGKVVKLKDPQILAQFAALPEH